MSDDEYIPQEWTYTGRRPLSNGKLGYTYLDHDGKVAAFEKLAASVIGGVYIVQYSPVTGMVRRAVRYDRPSGRPEADEWAAEDSIAYNADLLRKREAAQVILRLQRG